MTTSDTRTGDGLSALATGFARDVPGVAHAAVVSPSGSLVAASVGLPPGRAAQLSDTACRLMQLSEEAADTFTGSGVIQAMIEMELGYLYVMALSTGGCLAAVASPRAELGVLAYEMAVLVDQIELELGTSGVSGAQRAV